MNIKLPEGVDVHCVSGLTMLAENFKSIEMIDGKCIGQAGFRSFRGDENTVKFELFAGVDAMTEIGQGYFRFTARDVRRKYFSAVYSFGGQAVTKGELLKSAALAVLCFDDKQAYIYVASLKVSGKLLQEHCSFRLPLPRKLCADVLHQNPVSMEEAMNEILCTLDSKHKEISKFNKVSADIFMNRRTHFTPLMAHAVRASIMKISDQELAEDLKLPEQKIVESQELEVSEATTEDENLPEIIAEDIVELEDAEPATPTLTPEALAEAQASAARNEKGGKQTKRDRNGRFKRKAA